MIRGVISKKHYETQDCNGCGAEEWEVLELYIGLRESGGHVTRLCVDCRRKVVRVVTNPLPSER